MENLLTIGGLVNAPNPALPTQSHLYLVAHDSLSAPAEKFAPLSNLLVDLVLPLLTGCEFKVYGFLLRHADRKTGRVVKSLEEIAAGSGCSRVTAWRALQRHEALGLLTEQHRYALRDRKAPGPKSAQIRNAYTLTAGDCWLVEGAHITTAKAEPKACKNEKRPVQKRQESVENEQAKQTLSQTLGVKQQHAPPEILPPEGRTPAVAAQIASLDCSQSPDTTQPHTRPDAQLAQECEQLMAQVLAVGVKPESRVRQLIAQHAPEKVRLQLACLDDRNPRNRPGTFIKALTEDWEAPPAYAARLHRQEAQRNDREAQMRRDEDRAQRRQQEAAGREQQARDEAALDAQWENLDKRTRTEIESQARAALGVLARRPNAEGAMRAQRREILRRRLQG